MVAEHERLAEIDRLALLDEPGEALDGVAALAAQICRTPMALVSVVGERFLSLADTHGLERCSVSRRDTPCDRVVVTKRALQVRDLRAEPRFAAGAHRDMLPDALAYLGVPLQSTGGLSLGTLAVADTVVRDFDDRETDALRALARRVVRELEQSRELERARAARDDLQQAQDALRLALDESPVGVAMCEFDGRFRWVSSSFCNMLGYEKRQLAALTSREITHPDDLSSHKNVITRLLAGETASARWSKRYVRKDGSVMNGLAHVAVVRDHLGRPLHTVVHIEDVTETVKVEEAERQSQRMESLGTLAGGIAHDFNNLLCVIVSAASLLQEEIPKDDPRREDVDDVLAAAGRAAWMTRQLLVFSRRDVEAPEGLDFGELLRRTETLLSRTLGEKVRLDVVAPQQLPLVRMAAVYAEQVLLNLAVNARDAMPKGGRLTLVAEGVTVDVVPGEPPPVTPGKYVRIRVSDTGTGMSPEVRARIFEPFFTTKGREHGTGLGMAMVYGILQEAGGHITVDSEPGRGTVFEILLPVDESAGRLTRERRPQSLLASGHGIRVLVVEDDDGMRKIIARLLQRHDFEVVTARDGATAIEMFERDPDHFDVVLTDVVMPGPSGGDVLDRIAALRPDQPVVLMSGYADDEVRQHVLLAEDRPFVRKPFTPATLMQTLASAVSGTKG